MMPRLPRLHRQRRGSVLVFAVVLLVLLALLAAAFILYVRRESQASANAMQGSQGDRAVDSAWAFTRRQIREAVRQYLFVTPDGQFEANAANADVRAYLRANPAPLAGSPQENLFRLFEAYSGELTAPQTIAHAEGHAWAWWHENGAFFVSSGLESAAEPVRFCDAKLSIYAKPDGDRRVHFTGGPEHAGLARRFVVAVDQPGLGDFYDPAAGKPLQRATWNKGEHAEFYVWVADLDGMLHANPQSWGTDASIYLAETNESAAKETIKSLRGYGPGLPLMTDAHVDLLWTRGSIPYGSHGEIWLHLGIAVPPSGDAQVYNHYDTRYGLDRYFHPFRDDALASAPAGMPSAYIKASATALNVNSANFETLAAAISRVPLLDDYDPSDPLKVTANQTKASAIAARICAKRPFLCRMDFEDFLAAHLDQDVTLPQLPLTDAANATRLAGLIYRAIPKRASNAAVANPYTMPTLEELTEIPGIAGTHPLGSILLDPVKQQERFEFFRADDAAYAPTADALLTLKAFNNLCNAIFGQKRDGMHGYSYYTAKSAVANIPFDGTSAGTPKFEYKELLQADLDASGASEERRYVIERDPLIADEPGELLVWRATNETGFYGLVFNFTDDEQKVEYERTVTTTNPGEKVVFVNLNGAQESPHWGNDQTDAASEIYEFSDLVTMEATCESTVHGPLRVYKNTPFDNAALIHDAPDGTDVSWAPRFAFRSRFFAVYILARPLDVKGNPLRGGERRLEVYYDALKDQVLWRRQPATLKRALGDPEP